MEENEDSQFTLQELLDVMDEHNVDARYFKKKLNEKYGDVIITSVHKQTPTVYFGN